MDKFKFDEKEVFDIITAAEELNENPRFTRDDFISRIETLISSRADSVLSSLPAPTQDGTAEEFMDQWSNHNSWRSKGGIHKMITAYAAPLRAEIERLKSELAASVSPKLVLPSDEDKQNAYLNMYPEMEESDGFDDGFIEAWEAYESELRRLNPSLFK